MRHELPGSILELDPQDWTNAAIYDLVTALVVPRPVAWVSTLQGPVKVAVCTKCPSMPATGIWLLTWTDTLHPVGGWPPQPRAALLFQPRRRHPTPYRFQLDWV